jgi:hypothetical protein
MRSRAPLVATVILLLVSGVMATPHSPGCGEATAFAAPQRPYVAFRRLEAENQKSGRQGWLDVRTELGTDGVLTVEVLDEGGSEYIRNKVLRAALDGERQLIATRAAGPVPSVDTTTCTQSLADVSGADASGLVRVPLRPGRKGEVGLIYGNIFLQPGTGDLVRVEGRLAKNPSFWVSQVDVSWTYAKVHNDIVLPVSLHSVAKVKMFGPSTFHMTYDYRSVDGQAVSAGSRASR